MPTTRTQPTRPAPKRKEAPAVQRPAFRPSVLAGRGAAVSRRGVAIAEWLREVRSEVRKVVWPTREEARNLTIVVIALSVAVGAFLGGVDFAFQELFRWLFSVVGAGG